jgi:hypothetical protein
MNQIGKFVGSAKGNAVLNRRLGLAAAIDRYPAPFGQAEAAPAGMGRARGN